MNKEIEQIENEKDGIKEFIENIIPFLKKVLVEWKKILIINTIVAIIASAVLILFVKNYYDSTITILPDYGGSGSLLGGLGGLAAMAGISVGQSPPSEIYNSLLYSESVLIPVINSKYKTEKFDEPVNLIEYYELQINTVSEDASKELKERDKLLQMIELFNKGIISSSVDRVTSILTVTIRTNEATLSADICNNLVKSLDFYVRTKRKSNAREQKKYIENRVNQVFDSLKVIENKLKNFREQNRIVTQSPQLMLEQGRLTRDLEIQQTVFIELTKQMELIKLEEIKDTPIINPREEAGNPIKKEGPRRSIYLLIILICSTGITIGYIIFYDKIVEYFMLYKNSI